MKHIILTTILLINAKVFLFSQTDSIYYGQTPPQDEAVVFAPHIISITDRYEHDICFSPDGKEMFFTISEPNWSNFTIYHSYWNDTIWTEPEKAPFSKQYKNTEITFSPDGKSILFASSQPPGEEPWNFAIFKSEKTGAIWGNAAEIGLKSIQPSGNDGNWHPTMANDQSIYFSSYSSGNYDIYYSENINGNYSSFENIGSGINSTSNDFYPWISPNKEFMIFCSDRAGGYGKSDLYISYANESGTWSQPINMGEKVNTNDDETCPRMTSDGQYLFFTRTKNWDGDFYWIHTDFIKNLNLNAIDNNPSNNMVNIYPNPSKGIFNIEIKQQSTFVKCIIYDINGHEILLNLNANTNQIDLSQCKKGCYVLSIFFNDKVVTEKLFVN